MCKARFSSQGVILDVFWDPSLSINDVMTQIIIIFSSNSINDLPMKGRGLCNAGVFAQRLTWLGEAH